MLRTATRRAMLYPTTATATGDLVLTTTKNGTFTPYVVTTSGTTTWIISGYPAQITNTPSWSLTGNTVDCNLYFEDAAAVTQWRFESESLIGSLDASVCPALTLLYCYSTGITALDVSNNTALTDLRCYSTDITALDVSNNTALTDLNCAATGITALDVSNNTALTLLYCQSTDITALDVSNNTALTTLHCALTDITALDVSNSTALTDLRCYSTGITALDVSNNTALTNLLCYNNGFSQAVVDQILSAVEAYGTSNGTLNVGGSNAAPSAAGLADKALLEGRGWTVTVTA